MTGKQLLILIVTIIIASAVCRGAYIEDCGSKIGTFVSLNITGCEPTMSQCPLHRGTNATIQINFTTSEEVETVTAIVHGKLGPAEVPFKLPNPQGCLNSGLSCPLQPSQTYIYSTTLPVLKNYPKVRVTVKWELVGENGDDIVCILIPAKLV